MSPLSILFPLPKIIEFIITRESEELNRISCPSVLPLFANVLLIMAVYWEVSMPDLTLLSTTKQFSNMDWDDSMNNA